MMVKVRFGRFYVLTLSIIISLSILSVWKLHIVNITHCLAGWLAVHMRVHSRVCVRNFFLFSLLLIDLPILCNKTPCISVFDANHPMGFMQLACRFRLVFNELSKTYNYRTQCLGWKNFIGWARKARMQIAPQTETKRKKQHLPHEMAIKTNYRLCVWELAAYDSACMGNFVQFFACGIQNENRCEHIVYT